MAILTRRVNKISAFLQLRRKSLRVKIRLRLLKEKQFVGRLRGRSDEAMVLRLATRKINGFLCIP